MFSSILPDANKYAPHERALRAWDEKGGDGDAAVAEAIFARFRGQVDADVQAVRQRVFEAGLVSKAAEEAACRWIAAQHRRLARGASRVASAFARAAPTGDGTLRMLLLTLNYQGESTKSPFMQARFHAGLNATMVQALATGRWKESATLEIDGVKVHCCASSLFFRAALLARFAGGGLSVRQMEIFDAWLWIWSTHLHGSLEPPGEGAWRVDLDSSEGLRRGTRTGEGAVLYLAQGPLETARLSIVEAFHQGRVVPGSGSASHFAIAEYVTVLDALEAIYQRFRAASPMRAPRREANLQAELHVGLAEVTRKGLAALPELSRRMVNVINESDSGLAFEAGDVDCADIALDDLISLRVSHDDPVLVGRVVRRLNTEAGGRVVVGVRILSRNAKTVRVRPVPGGGIVALPHITLLYLAGEDNSGRDDSYLSNEVDGKRRELLETTAGSNTYTFRLNRAREQGRGWVRSGFEIASSTTRN